jgi:hypothetical protein
MKDLLIEEYLLLMVNLLRDLKKFVFGDEDQNLQTLTANIMRANISHMLSDTSKLNISVLSSDYEKMYQNLYAAAYDATTNVVTMDGYYDPTERDNFMMSANLVSELDFWWNEAYSLSGYRSN